MRIFKIRSSSPVVTKRIAASIARKIPAGVCIKLKGPFGAGKTTFVAGFVGSRKVSSPSFAIKKVYRVARRSSSGRFREAHHIDLWRLAPGADVADLFEASPDISAASRRVYLVEWAERLPAGFPRASRAVTVRMNHAGPANTRDIVAETSSPALARILKAAVSSNK